MSNSTRPSSSYDERFVVPLEASRRGAHRARVSPVMAMLPVAAVVGIVVGAIALVYALFGSLGGGSSTTAASASPVASATQSSGAETTPSASSSAATTAASTVDKSLAVSVYNGTSPVVSGLARKAANKLTAAGWTLGEVQTWTGSPVSVTTVYYGAEDQRASAQAVAKSLGKGVVRLSATNAGSGLAVVVGNDYPGAAGGSGSTKSSSARSTRASTTAAASTSATRTTDSSQPPTEQSSPSSSTTG